MEPELVDGQILKGMFASATAWLEKSTPDINAINVFPVPDGDTGTNMLLTMKSAMEEANRTSDSDVSSVAKSMAYGSLMGARGNSGVILSQFWRGLAKGLQGRTHCNGRQLASALTAASQTAYEGIVNPVEGTILTVLKDASIAAETACENDHTLVSVMEAAARAAQNSVARTPSLLPVLKKAGVVDAGGQGLYVLLEGALHFLKGDAQKIEYWTPSIVAAEPALAPRSASMATAPEMPYGYCTNFVVEGQGLNPGKIRKDLSKKGQSLMVTGSDSLIRVHIHSFAPGEVLQYATRLGKLHQIVISNMDDQYVEFIKMQRERIPMVDISLITVASGDGLFEVFSSLGNAIVVPGGQTMNPSVRELLQAVESAPSDKVILLPNNKNIILTASQVQSLTSKSVRVVSSRTIPQGVAAFLAFNYDMNLEENAQSMDEAITRVKTIEITRAVRKTQLYGLTIKKGQFIAILDDERLIANSDRVSDAIFEALRVAEAENMEIATMYYGAGVQISEAEEIAQGIGSRYQVEVELIHGGQPHYDYIISLE